MTGVPHDKGHPTKDGGPGRAATGDDPALKITVAQMDAAVRTGDATPLELGGGWLMAYRGTWWVRSEVSWLRITDEATMADIDHVAARLAEVAWDAASDAPSREAGRRRRGEGDEG